MIIGLLTPAAAHAQNILGRQLGTTTLFGELTLPLRFQDQNNSIGIGIHLGLGF